MNCTHKPTVHRCFRWQKGKEPEWFQSYAWQYEVRGDHLWLRQMDGSYDKVPEGTWIVEYRELGFVAGYDDHLFLLTFDYLEDPPLLKFGPGGSFCREI